MNEEGSKTVTRGRVFGAAFFVILIFILYQAAQLIAPFASALIWGSIIALGLYPLHKRMLALVKNRGGLAAIIMTALAVVIVIGPAGALIAALASQAADLYHQAAVFIQGDKWADIWEGMKTSIFGPILAPPISDRLNIKDMVLRSLGEISTAVASQFGDVIKNTLLFVLNFFIMIFSLFFIFRDGGRFYSRVMELVPLSDARKQAVTRKLADTFYAVIYGMLLVAIFQGIMTGLGFAIFGVPFAVFWGAIAAFLALLPVGGAALVWVPGALYLIFTGSILKGILLGGWGLLLVSLPDNFLKPLLIGRKAKLPTFFLFLAILGGLKVYGLLGILIGPLIVTLVTAFVQIYKEEYAEKAGA